MDAWLILSRKIDDFFQLHVHFLEKCIELSVRSINGEQMGDNDHFAVFRPYCNIARHIGYGGRRHFQHLPGRGQVAKLDGVIVGERHIIPLPNHTADVVVPGNAEVVLGYRQFQFCQYFIVRLDTFRLIPAIRFYGSLMGKGR